MNRTIKTVPVTATLPPLERGYYDELGRPRRDDGRCRPEMETTTFVTTCSTRSQFRDKKGSLQVGKMTTIRLYGVQGVEKQPVPQAPKDRLYIREAYDVAPAEVPAE